MTIIDIIQKIRNGYVDSGVEIKFTPETWTEWRPKLYIVRDTFRAARDMPAADKVSRFIEAQDKEFQG